MRKSAIALLGLGALTALGFATGRLVEFPRSLLALWLVFTPLLTIASHTMLRQVCRAMWTRGINTRAFAIVGVNEVDLVASLGLGRLHAE